MLRSRGLHLDQSKSLKVSDINGSTSLAFLCGPWKHLSSSYSARVFAVTVMPLAAGRACDWSEALYIFLVVVVTIAGAGVWLRDLHFS